MQILCNYTKVHKLKIENPINLFAISTLDDIVRIPPSLFGTSLNKAAINILKSKYESMVNISLGYIIMILDAKVEMFSRKLGDRYLRSLNQHLKCQQG